MVTDSVDPDVARELERTGGAELVVGVIAYNSGRSVRRVVEAAAAAAASYYPERRVVIAVVDGGSRDGTVEAARGAAGRCPLVVIPQAARTLARLGSDAGPPGKGGGLRTALTAAAALGAAGCAVVDADVATITPEWVRRLFQPVLEQGLDLVAPLYARHKYDGMLTSFLVYPLTRALYGRRLRQPVGGHFGFSGALARRLVAGGAWEGAAIRYRRDLWVTTKALADGLPVGQAALGPGRRGAREPEAGLAQAFSEVVGTAFSLMEEYRPAWRAVVETADVSCTGDPPVVGTEPVSVNVDRMIATFRQAAADLVPVWRRMLAADTCAAVLELAADSEEAPRFPASLWARVVYDGAAAHHARLLPRGQLLRALIPLYLGCAAAYVLETADGDGRQAEARVEAACIAFEAGKAYLLDRWDARRA
jgi:hypothetical protein